MGASSCVEFVSTRWNAHPPVGTFIAVLGLLGVLVPLFREWGKIGRREKALWTIAMFALLLLEFRTLYLDRDEHEQEQKFDRCKDRESFQAIATTLGNSITQAQTQYGSTIRHVDGVLKAAQQVSALTQKNLENVTGGDSFAYVFPSEIFEGQSAVTLNVHNDGAQLLTGVVVTVRHITRGSADPSINDRDLEMIGPAAINIGSLAPHEGRNVPPPGGLIQLARGPNGDDHYHFWINAQNPGTSENLDFRQSLNGRGWAYKVTAWKVVTGKRRKGDFLLKNVHLWIRYVKPGKWVEPSKRR